MCFIPVRRSSSADCTRRLKVLGMAASGPFFFPTLADISLAAYSTNTAQSPGHVPTAVHSALWGRSGWLEEFFISIMFRVVPLIFADGPVTKVFWSSTRWKSLLSSSKLSTFRPSCSTSGQSFLIGCRRQQVHHSNGLKWQQKTPCAVLLCWKANCDVWSQDSAQNCRPVTFLTRPKQFPWDSTQHQISVTVAGVDISGRRSRCWQHSRWLITYEESDPRTKSSSTV